MQSASTRQQALAPQIARFVAIGGLGFAVDLGLTLFSARVIGLDPGGARAIAIAIAVGITFILNRRVTFASSDPAVFREALRYCAVSLAGAAMNFCFYQLVLAHAGPSALALALAVVFGSGVAMAANFTGMRLFAFAR